MGHHRHDDPAPVPTGHPDPACNTGYAEPQPKDKAQAQIPGAKLKPDDEEGGLEHDSDPEA